MTHVNENEKKNVKNPILKIQFFFKGVICRSGEYQPFDKIWRNSLNIFWENAFYNRTDDGRMDWQMTDQSMDICHSQAELNICKKNPLFEFSQFFEQLW